VLLYRVEAQSQFYCNLAQGLSFLASETFPFSGVVHNVASPAPTATVRGAAGTSLQFFMLLWGRGHPLEVVLEFLLIGCHCSTVLCSCSKHPISCLSSCVISAKACYGLKISSRGGQGNNVGQQYSYTTNSRPVCASGGLRWQSDIIRSGFRVPVSGRRSTTTLPTWFT
jgi:hypothetical protein